MMPLQVSFPPLLIECRRKVGFRLGGRDVYHQDAQTAEHLTLWLSKNLKTRGALFSYLTLVPTLCPS